MDWRTFHSLTNHHPERSSPEADPDRPIPMDPARRPHPFKEYETNEPPIQLIDRRSDWLRGALPDGLDLEGLSRILLIGAGAKRYKRPELRGRYFRTYASAGALHPNEIYVATAGLDGLDAGLYHFDPRGKALVRLGEGDPRGMLGGESAIEAPVVLVVTGIPWRTSWKYRERGYRHLWWDAGMIIANLMALADRAEVSSSVKGYFPDDEVNDLIGIDGSTEMALALVTLGSGGSRSAGEFTPHTVRALPVGPDPYEFSDITAVHRSTAEGSPPRELDDADSSVPKIPGEVPVDEVIWRRGSTRAFDPEVTTDTELAIGILRYAAAPFPCDWTRGLCEIFVIAHGIDGMQPGAYKWERDQLHLIEVDEDSRDSATFLSLEQSLGGDGAFAVFPMAALDRAADSHGDRGYRVAQLEGAVISGRLYLAAYAAGLGATGLTFFDEEVTKYFGATASPMLEVSVGTPATRGPAVPPVATPQNLDFKQVDEDGLPLHWQPASRGHSIQAQDGVLAIESLAKRPREGGLWQAIEAGDFRGKRVTVSAEISSEVDERSVAGLFLNVVGPKGMAAWDNMWESPVSGPTPWGGYSVSVRIPEDATRLTIGVWVKAVGTVRFRNLALSTEP